MVSVCLSARTEKHFNIVFREQILSENAVEPVLSELASIFDEQDVLTDPDSLSFYGSDRTRFVPPCPLAVVMIRDEKRLISLIMLARKHGVGLVPSGGRTGLSGGALAPKGEIVVSFEKYNRVLEFNDEEASVRVQAGVITEQIQLLAEEHGLLYPVNFASAGSSQIGGNIATNAGGIRVIRYGMTRDWITGLRVITGKGEILELNYGLTKNATGYDLRHLFIGSEGTLGFITEAIIKLTRPPLNPVVYLLSVENMEHVTAVLGLFQKHLDILAFEFFSDAALEKVLAHRRLDSPLENRSPYYVLAEFEAIDESSSARALELFEQSVEEGLVLDGVCSRNESDRKRLWQYREGISEAIAEYMPYKNDISVRPSRTSVFLDRLDKLVKDRYPDFQLIWFGHIGDGNLHLNILKPAEMTTDAFVSHCEQVNQILYGLVKEMQGSVSAEHGIGLLKSPYLGFTRSDSEIQAMLQIKSIFDPDGIMNPGKLFRRSAS